jgi:hypothetical protein
VGPKVCLGVVSTKGVEVVVENGGLVGGMPVKDGGEGRGEGLADDLLKGKPPEDEPPKFEPLDDDPPKEEEGRGEGRADEPLNGEPLDDEPPKFEPLEDEPPKEEEGREVEPLNADLSSTYWPPL